MLKQFYFKLNYIRKQLIFYKMAYSGYFSLGGNLDFLKKSFITSTIGDIIPPQANFMEYEFDFN